MTVEKIPCIEPVFGRRTVDPIRAEHRFLSGDRQNETGIDTVIDPLFEEFGAQAVDLYKRCVGIRERRTADVVTLRYDADIRAVAVGRRGRRATTFGSGVTLPSGRQVLINFLAEVGVIRPSACR